MASAKRATTIDEAMGSHGTVLDRKSTRLNSSHLGISYAVFCLKKKKHKRQGQIERDPARGEQEDTVGRPECAYEDVNGARDHDIRTLPRRLNDDLLAVGQPGNS